MANMSKNRKSHKTDALMRLLMSGSSGAVNPSISVTFKEDIIRPINDKKNAPRAAAEPVKGSESAHINTPQMPQMNAPEMPRMNAVEERVSVPQMPRTAPPPQIVPQISPAIPEQPRPEIAAVKINPEHPTELDIVRELIKELLPTAIQRFNVCYCDTCYSAMTEAVLKRSPKIVIMVRSKDDLARGEYLKKQNRNNVLRTVIKEVLDYKTTGRHNNSALK
jgi:hypothetical protein